MAENDITNYTSTLLQALISRKDWLEKSELGRLKETLRTFQTSFASLYNIYLKKKLINEDPYKQETKISELEVPETGMFNEAKRTEQLSIRLSSFDSQLDFLVNFYQLGMDFLNLERIKRIVGLIRFIDWASLTPDSQSANTRVVAEISNQSKVGVDPITLSIIGESLSRLAKTTVTIMGILKDLNLYYRESYKVAVRQAVTQNMSASEANAANIKKKMQTAMPGTAFLQDLIDEIIKEDYSKNGAELKEALLKYLKVAEEKPKVVKAPVNFKGILLDGIQVIGGASVSLNEIGVKLDENQTVMESRKKGLLEMLKNLIRQITNAEPEEVIYAVEYLDNSKGVSVKEKVSFHQFREDMYKKAKILNSFVRGPAYAKLSAMTEEQIIGYLERNINDVQYLHKILNALDDYFKANVLPEDRDKIKGIKPELSAMKNSFVKANQLKHEYSAQVEEEEQMKRLGITSTGAEARPPSQPSK
ncbi:MAG: hypothetical protein LBG91_00740 [Treponema sp.]|jgi:hypothetical protein|nr:hypothetical protein [Treponema sp.]